MHIKTLKIMKSVCVHIHTTHIHTYTQHTYSWFVVFSHVPHFLHTHTVWHVFFQYFLSMVILTTHRHFQSGLHMRHGTHASTHTHAYTQHTHTHNTQRKKTHKWTEYTHTEGCALHTHRGLTTTTTTRQCKRDVQERRGRATRETHTFMICCVFTRSTLLTHPHRVTCFFFQYFPVVEHLFVPWKKCTRGLGKTWIKSLRQVFSQVHTRRTPSPRPPMTKQRDVCETFNVSLTSLRQDPLI